MRDAVMSLDPQGIVTAVNPAFEAIFDVTASELVGRSFAETMIEHPELEAFNDTVFDAVTDPSNTATHDIVVKRGGERRYLSVRTNLLRMPDTSARHGLIAAIVFSAFHAAWGFTLVLFTFVSSFLFGWMYNRHGTLIGVSILHFLLGTVIFVLGLN